MTLFNDLGQLSRGDLEQVAAMVAAQMQLPWAASPVVHGLTGGFPLSQTPGVSFFAQITGSVSGGSNPTQYNWTEAVELGSGLFIPLPGGRSDNGLALPAYEVSDNTAVPTDGTVFVRMWQSETNGNFYFSWQAGVVPGFSGALLFLTGDQSIAGQSAAASGYTVQYDTSAYYSASQPTRLTAPARGKYLCGGEMALTWTTTPPDLQAFISINGSATGGIVAQFFNNPPAKSGQLTEAYGFSMSAPVTLGLGDYAEMFFQTSGAGVYAVKMGGLSGFSSPNRSTTKFWMHRLDAGGGAGSASSFDIGTTKITGGVAGNILIDNGGTVGEDSPGTLDTALGTAVGSVTDGTYGG